MEVEIKEFNKVVKQWKLEFKSQEMMSDKNSYFLSDSLEYVIRPNDSPTLEHSLTTYTYRKQTAEQ